MLGHNWQEKSANKNNVTTYVLCLVLKALEVENHTLHSSLFTTSLRSETAQH